MMSITPEMARAELARRELARRQSQSIPSGDEKTRGILSIPGDIIESGANLLMKGGEKAMQIPDEISSAGQQLAENPISGTGRAAGGILSGLLEGGKQLYNLPFNINTYLGSKGVFPFKQTSGIAEKLKIGDTGLQKAVMGEQKPGDVLFEDIGAIAPLFAAPESIARKIPSVSSKGLIKQLSKEKSRQLDIAKKDYAGLFDEAAENGITHAIPSKEILKNQSTIIKNSTPKHHESLKNYLSNPTIENAHWAQSELGSLQRHLDKISQKNGLTPTQLKTYKAVEDTRKSIKNSMFSENSLGKNNELALRYKNLSEKYKNNVIPYTRLEDLSEFEFGKLRPKTAIKNLLNDEEFMIKLAKKYPGIYLKSPQAAKIGLAVGGGALGYDELRKLFKGD